MGGYSADILVWEVIFMGLVKENEKYKYEDYKTWDDGEDWEIIAGEAYNMSPSPSTKHQSIAGKLHIDLGAYLKDKPCKVFFELDVVLSEEDIVKPDIIIICDKDKIKENNIKGAPDLIIEILSKSTAKKDRGLKYDLYKKSGVKEYWIVDPYYLEIDVHNFGKNSVEKYFYEDIKDDSEEKNVLKVDLFNGELEIDVNYVLGE